MKTFFHKGKTCCGFPPKSFLSSSFPSLKTFPQMPAIASVVAATRYGLNAPITASTASRPIPASSPLSSVCALRRSPRIAAKTARKAAAISAVNSTCITCGTTAGFRCSACKTARYCSDTCQLADWKMHKLACYAK